MSYEPARHLPGPGDRGLELGRDTERLLRSAGEHVFAVKITYWLGG